MDNNFDMSIVETRAVSRRSFLVSSGGVGVAVAFGAIPEAAFAATGSGSFDATAWVGIGVVRPGGSSGQPKKQTFVFYQVKHLAISP